MEILYLPFNLANLTLNLTNISIKIHYLPPSLHTLTNQTIPPSYPLNPYSYTASNSHSNLLISPFCHNFQSYSNPNRFPKRNNNLNCSHNARIKYSRRSIKPRGPRRDVPASREARRGFLRLRAQGPAHFFRYNSGDQDRADKQRDCQSQKRNLNPKAVPAPKHCRLHRLLHKKRQPLADHGVLQCRLRGRFN